MTEPTIGSLCSGYDGLAMAVQAVFGGKLAWWSDIEPGPIAAMKRHHPGVPNLGDLKLVDWTSPHRVPWVEILIAGYPCQPFSNAGKRLAENDDRHLWPYIADAVGALRPAIIVLENVAAHLRRGFDRVAGDLAALGYDARWTVVRASDIGAPHRRERLFILATDTPSASGRRRRARQETGETQGGGRSDFGRRSSATDANGARPQERNGRSGAKLPATQRNCDTAANTACDGRDQGRSESARIKRGSNAANGSCDAATDANGQRFPKRSELYGASLTRQVSKSGHDISRRTRTDFGDYQAAIDRWEGLLGRPAPEPTTTGQRGARVLNPVFVEWMMGLPAGYVTDLPGLTRNQILMLLGNGVVPQQAECALRRLVALDPKAMSA